MLYQPTFDDHTDYLVAWMMREYTDMVLDYSWFDNVARFDHWQLKPMRRRGIFF